MAAGRRKQRMSREKHIDQKQVVQMARDICCKRDKPQNCKDCDVMWCKAQLHAFRAYKAGYRKQEEGEWVRRYSDHTDHLGTFKKYDGDFCSICGVLGSGNFCPNCGAKMKGGE
jgi:hypothetical protein